ncbi:MAG: alpha/beta hydrolase [Catenulispora sp. 13_1_20CM_3_70_7]|jgi:pimeloyl-ACP methyl ester carboxylesterase|nr:alpha/beta hydrolase [Catenulisporales bacterium]OLE26856.1 MAG: alpha/beta hydrolase [Catenulispora sp. 13_1_20CM_3_70_7]
MQDSDPIRLPGPWTHRDINANGGRFHVAEMGEGPLVLFLHGFPEFWWSWRHQLPVVADAGFRAVAMDLRGYGGSDKTPRGYDPLTLTMDVTGVIRALGQSNATLVGHGWGAFLAWTAAVFRPAAVNRLAVTGSAHPRRLRQGLLTDPKQIAAARFMWSAQRPWAPEKALTRDAAMLVEQLLAEWGATGWPELDVAQRYRDAMLVPGAAHSSLEYYRWLVRSLVRPDGMRFAQRMRTEVRVPVLHMQGELDSALLPHIARGSGRYVTAAYRWRLLEGIGHFAQEEAPMRFNNELIDWLKS